MTFLANDKEVLRLYNMVADGEPIEKIMRYTGLTKESVENLKV